LQAQSQPELSTLHLNELQCPDWFVRCIAILRVSSSRKKECNHWMRERAEARKEGAVLDYHRIQNTVLVTPGRKVGDPNSMVLITEYKNMAAFLQSEKLFASIRERLPKSTPGVFKPTKPDDPYETVDSQVFVEEPETSGGFKLVAKR
jgi:hypothetical protein